MSNDDLLRIGVELGLSPQEEAPGGYVDDAIIPTIRQLRSQLDLAQQDVVTARRHLPNKQLLDVATHIAAGMVGDRRELAPVLGFDAHTAAELKTRQQSVARAAVALAKMLITEVSK